MSSDSSQNADLELQFKKRARRRLVGAISLVLVMLAVLPMVLDDHQKNPPQQAVTISIPSQNAEFTTEAPLKAPEPAPVKTAPNPAVENPPQVAVPVIESNTKPENKPNNDSTSNPQLNEALETKPGELKKTTEIKKTAEIKKPEEVKKSESPKTIPIKKVDDDQGKAKIKSEDKSISTQEKVAEASGKPYYLQIGVFSDSVNVAQLQKKLVELKLKPYTEKLPTDKGDKTRLRVGPFDSKDQADHAAEKVKTIGLSGFVSNK